MEGHKKWKIQNENILSAFFKCTVKNSGILKSHILSPKGLPCSLKMEHLPGDEFHLHSKNSITRSSVLFDMEVRNPSVNQARKISWFSTRWFSHCSWRLFLKTAFPSFNKNLFIMLEEHYSFFFSPPISAMDWQKFAKHNFPKKLLTNYVPFSGSVTWDCRVCYWAAALSH